MASAPEIIDWNKIESFPVAEQRRAIAATIDYAILHPAATHEQLQQVCAEAIELQCYGICINPAFVRQAQEWLKDTPVKIIGVVSFPLGTQDSELKCIEAERWLAFGANEIDLVANAGWIKSGEWNKIESELQKLRSITTGTCVKVIIECALLTEPEKQRSAQIIQNCGFDFIKTGTGFFGATSVADVQLLRSILKPQTKIKASGGIRDFQTALAMLKAGASRLGTSTPGNILKQMNSMPLPAFGH